MASSSSSGTAAGAGGRVVLSEEGATAMAECIGLLFGRWTALQLAVQNRWGGLDSQAKADRLASSVLSWFTRAAARGTGPLDQDELEGLLYDAMDESFNADIEDGSVEEVTKHLMIMYTRCLQQNYSYIDKLRTQLAGSAITQSKEEATRVAAMRSHAQRKKMMMSKNPLRHGGYESSSDEISRSEEEDEDD